MSAVSTGLGSAVASLVNQPAQVTLGSLVLSGAEAPSRITIGGRQLAAIHKLPGGARIIDAMGPDDNAVVWQGVFIGPSAATRVRMVDALRSAGEPCMLAFGDYLFEVVVVEFRYSYEARGAVISYSIRAEKTRVETEALTVSALTSAISDCAAATQFLTNTQASIAAYGGLTGGLSGGAASTLLSGVLSTVGSVGSDIAATDVTSSQLQALLSSTGAVQTAIPLLSTGNLATAVTGLSVTSGAALASVTQQAGALAGIVAAGGLLNRAGASLASADASTVAIGVYS